MVHQYLREAHSNNEPFFGCSEVPTSDAVCWPSPDYSDRVPECPCISNQAAGSIHRVLGCVVALEMTDEMFAPRDSCQSIRTGALRSRRQVCSRASAAQLN